MGQIDVLRSHSTSDADTIEFAGATPDEIADKVGVFLLQRGYRRESGDKFLGLYGRGSAAAHVLVGALAPRYKFNVAVAKTGDGVMVTVSKGMSGMSGGVIGSHQLTKEFQELQSGLETFIVATGTAVAAPPPAAAAATGPAVSGVDIPDQIRKLGELLAQGLLTKEEFEAKKVELLARL